MVYNPDKPYKNQVLQLIKETWNTPYLAVQEGTYPIFKKRFDHSEVDHTDGIGTKGIYHWERKTFDNAVIDALAMNLNDLAMVRAKPYKLQCHLILPEENVQAILRIMRKLAKECRRRKIAITGGETSIQNNLQGMDISLTVSGFIEKKAENQLKAGDALIGFKSSGLHSNGFTLARKELGEIWRKEFTAATKIYSEMIFKLDKKYDIHGMMHITGGAYTKLKNLMNGVDAVITNTHSLRPQPIFKEIYRKGVSDLDMYKTFNCGVGFVLSVPKRQATKIVSGTREMDLIGEIVPGSGKVKVSSMFSHKRIEL